MNIKKFLCAALAGAMMFTAIPTAFAADDYFQYCDARPNFDPEFVNSKFVKAEHGYPDAYLALAEDGTLWGCGGRQDCFEQGSEVGFHKLMTGVKDFQQSSSQIFILKDDNTVWTNSPRFAMSKNENPKKGELHKILDNVKQLGRFAALDFDGTVWAWSNPLNGQYLCVDVNAIPESHKISTQDGVQVKVPYKTNITDVKQIRGLGANTYILKNDGTLYSTGNNLFCANGNGVEHTNNENIAPDLYKLMEDVDRLDETLYNVAHKQDGSTWLWGTKALSGVYCPVPEKLGDDILMVGEHRDRRAHLDKNHVLHLIADDGEKSPKLGNVVWFNDDFAIRSDGSLWYTDGEPYYYYMEESSPGYFGFYDGKTQSTWKDANLFQLSGADVSDPIQMNTKPAEKPQQPQQPAKTETAKPNNAKVLVNGETVAFDAYNIGGNNFFKLRDLAYVLNGTEKQFEISWDADKRAINMLSDKPYTAVGGEMEKGAAKQQTAKLSADAVYLNGTQAELTAYNIAGNNYFKLRDLGKLFNFGVTWDDTARTIRIDTADAYVDE